MGSDKLKSVTSKTVLTNDDRAEIVRRYQEGATQAELARAFRCRFYTIRDVLTDARVTRKTLTANTPIELRLHDALRAAGIGFTTQRRLVGRYVVDISIHQAPVVIEADGARHRAGSDARKRDDIRDAAHRAAGYRVFRFTGSQINSDAAACIRQVIDACHLVADERSVYAVRATFSGSDHPRWADRMETVTCEYCQQPFEARKDRNARFCSPRHYNLYCRETGVLKGKPWSEEHLANVAAANREHARPHTPEARAKISAARAGRASPNKGKRMSAEQKAKISAALSGRKESDETRARKRAAHLGRKRDPEVGAKISAALKGKPKSAEHRAKISAARRAANQTKIESDPA